LCAERMTYGDDGKGRVAGKGLLSEKNRGACRVATPSMSCRFTHGGKGMGLHPPLGCWRNEREAMELRVGRRIAASNCASTQQGKPYLATKPN
jgi:hypothetical protein